MKKEDGEKGVSKLCSSNGRSKPCLTEITYKVYYFLFYGSIGSSIPFLAVYFKQLGLSAGHAGVLIGLRLLMEFIGAPLWGWIGDKYKKRKIILFFSVASFSAGTLLVLVVQPENQQCIETRGNKTLIYPLTFLPEGGVMILGQPIEKASQPPRFYNKSHVTTSTWKVDETELKKIFFICFGLIFVCQILGSVVYIMPNVLLIGILEGRSDKFGTFQMWGECSVAASSFLVGGVISLYESEVCGKIVSNYHISFYFFAGFSALSLITIFFMHAKYSDDELSQSDSIWTLVKELLLYRSLIFIALAFYLGVLAGLHEHFGLWYLDDLGAQPYMLGIAAGFRYAVASLGYLFSGTIITKIGPAPTSAVCLALYVAIYMGFAFVLNPWIGVVLFVSQGIMYSLGWATCVVFGAEVSSKAGFHGAIQGNTIL